MIKKLQNKLKSKKGFTLIELLIVIAVLGIIAAIAIPRFTGVLGDVKTKADKRSAELFAHEVAAEFVAGGLNALDATNGLTITSAAKAGFDGDVPASQSSTSDHLRAVITGASNSYTINIYIGTGTTPIATLANLPGPVN